MLICDRIEENFAVIYDDDKRIDVPLSQTDKSLREGDAVVLKDGIYYPDNEATQKQREKNTELMKKLGLL